MDACEATNVLISKIKKMDPENASKIMGFILLQALSDTDLASLASSNETLLRDVVLSAKTHLGIPTSSLSAPPTNPASPSPLNPISRPRNPFSRISPRVAGCAPFVDFATWPGSSSSDASISPKSGAFLSYDNVRSGPMLVPPRMRNGSCGGGDLVDEYQLDEYFSSSFMDDSEPVDPSGQLGSFLMDNGNARFHRRSFSESGACLGVEDWGFGVGYKPCMYYARGFCKNGDSCKFVHCGLGGDDVFEGSLMGSPRENDGLYLQQQEDFLRMKATQQQQQQQHRRLAYDKYMNFLLQQRDDTHRLGASPEIIGDEFHKFSRFRAERNDFLNMSMSDKFNSAARQIYLTFPADSSFRDEDVSNYFSTFGPVQDVRIPYQQKRMFGFVTFVHPETVKLILAQGNPHFICNSRVLVKPYKEKGKLVSERQQHLQQQLERGNFSPCSSPSAFDSRELFDLHCEARMLQDAQEMMLRRKLEEQAELQQAIELQGRRLLNLQLPDLRQEYIRQPQRSLSVGTPSPVQSQTFLSPNVVSNSNIKYLDASNGNRTCSVVNISASAANGSDQNLQPEITANCNLKSGAIEGKAENYNSEGSVDAHDRHGSNREHSLPDNLFGSPKSAGKQHTDFCPASLEV